MLDFAWYRYFFVMHRKSTGVALNRIAGGCLGLAFSQLILLTMFAVGAWILKTESIFKNVSHLHVGIYFGCLIVLFVLGTLYFMFLDGLFHSHELDEIHADPNGQYEQRFKK